MFTALDTHAITAKKPAAAAVSFVEPIAVTFVGDRNSQLSSPPEVAKMYTELSQSARSGVCDVHALHTFRHSPDERYTRGEVMELDENTPAVAIASRLRELGGHVSLIKLPEGTFDSRSQCSARMAANIAALLDDPTDARAAFARHGPADFSGVLRVSNGQATRVTGKLQPYLVVHTNVAEQSDRLREFVEQNPSLTVGQLADSQQLRDLQAEGVVKNRLKMAELANALSVQQHIATTPDATDCAAPGDEHHCPRDLATVDIDTAYGTLRRSEHDPSKVLFYNRVVDLNASTGDGVAVPLSPLQGVQLYQFRDDALAPADRSPSAIVNAHANSLPLGLPHDRHAAEPSAQLKEDADAVLHWPGKNINAASDAAVYAKLTRHAEARDVLPSYEKEYLNGGNPVQAGKFPFTPVTLIPMAVLVRPDLQHAQ